MGRFSTIRSEMWSDQDFRKLSPAGKLLYNYLLTSPVGNLAGYYALEVVQIKTNVCRYDKARGKFDEADEVFFENEILPELNREQNLWKYDFDTEQILIPNYLKYNKISGSRQLVAIGKSLKTLKICNLHIDFLCSLHKYVGDDAYNYVDPSITKSVIEMCKTVNSPEALYILNNIDTPFL